jgi:hypothetical protein
MIPLLIDAIRRTSDVDFILTESGRRAGGPDWQLDEAISYVHGALYAQLREYVVASMENDGAGDATDVLAAILSDTWELPTSDRFGYGAYPGTSCGCPTDAGCTGHHTDAQ